MRCLIRCYPSPSQAAATASSEGTDGKKPVGKTQEHDGHLTRKIPNKKISKSPFWNLIVVVVVAEVVE